MKKLKLIDLYKSLNDKPLDEQKTFGDLSPEEWEVEREKYGIKTHPEGHKYVSRKYDPGNEPLEIQYHEDQQLYYIDVEDIEAYVSGETVWATDPDRGGDDIEVNRENSDVSGVEEDELEDFMVSGDRSADDVDDDDRFSGMDDMFGADLEESKKRIWNRIKNWVKGDITLNQLQGGPGSGEGLEEEACTEEEIAEGTCGYGVDGELGDEPAGSHLYILDEKKPKLQESIMKKKL